LYNQLDIYKEQSNRDKEQINTLNRLLENQQILALESNKKIQKLENQLEEERQLNYSFDTPVNDRQNVNVQEATFAGESKDTDQQQEDDQPAERQYRDIPEEKKDENPNEEPPVKDDKQFKEIDDKDEEEEEKQSKKDSWR